MKTVVASEDNMHSRFSALVRQFIYKPVSVMRSGAYMGDGNQALKGTTK